MQKKNESERENGETYIVKNRSKFIQINQNNSSKIQRTL